jgi:hypothetical protein
MVCLEKFLQFIYGCLAVTDDLSQEPATDCLPGMYRYNRTSAVRMLKEVVAAPGTNYLKTYFLKSFDEALARDGRVVAHPVTATR